MLGRIFYLFEVAMKRNKKKKREKKIEPWTDPFFEIEETKRKIARPIESPKDFQKFLEKNHFRSSSKMIDERGKKRVCTCCV